MEICFWGRNIQGRNLLFPNGAQLIRGDIREPQSIAAALGNHHFDVVVDWVAFTPDHVRTDLELFRDRTGQYIYISSASAYQKPVLDYLMPILIFVLSTRHGLI